MLVKGKNVAIIGSSNNPEKYGHKITISVKKVANKVFPVNPKETQILGLTVFKDLKEIKEKIDIVDFVVPPAVTLEILKSNKNNAWTYWFQPGSFNESVISYCKENNLKYVDDLCIMLESDKEELQ